MTGEEKTDPGLPLFPEPAFEVFHEGKPTGVRGESYSQTLELAVQFMKNHPELKHVKVLHQGKEFRGGVWRNPKEGRLIKTKELG